MSRSTAVDTGWHAATRARLDARQRQTVASSLAETARTPPAAGATGLGTMVAAGNLGRRTLPPGTRKATARRLAESHGDQHGGARGASRTARPRRRRTGRVRATGATFHRHACSRRRRASPRSSVPTAGNETPAGGPSGPPHLRAATHPPGADADGSPEADHDAGALRERHRPPGTRGPTGMAAPGHGLRHVGSPAPAGRNRHASTGPAPLPTRTARPSRPGSATAAEPRPLSPARPDPDGGAAARRPARDPARAGSRGKLRHGATDRVDGTAPGRHDSETPIVRVAALRHERRRPWPAARRRSHARVTPNSTAKTSRSWTCSSRTPKSGGDAEQGFDVQGSEPLDGRWLERRRLLELAARRTARPGDEVRPVLHRRRRRRPARRRTRLASLADTMESRTRSAAARPDRTYSSTAGNPRSRAQRTTPDREPPGRLPSAS